MRSKWIRQTALGLGLVSLFSLPVTAQPLYTSVDDDDEEEEEADSEEDSPEWFAVVGADIHDGRGGVLRGASLLAKDGKIEEIGYDLVLPEETEVLDASGYRVYPGLVAVKSSGLFGGSTDLEDSVDPFNQDMVLALAAGITTAEQSNQAAKLKRGEIEGLVMNPKTSSSISFRSSDPKGKRTQRERFAAAAAYLRAYRQWEEDVKKDKELKEPSKSGIDSTALAVLRAEVLPWFSADERHDLLEIARLAQEYGFRPVIEGCGEGWTVADELGRAGAYAVVTPRYRRARSENLVRAGGSSIENAAKLHAAGVQVAIQPASTGVSLGGIVGRDIMHLTIEAGFAIRGGLSEQAAFEAITIVPARLLGVAHRVGTLEVGKDCDLVVTDGDIMHYQTFVQWAVVDGKEVYDKADELFFAHIRPRPESSIAPESKVDPGEEVVEEIEEVKESAD